MMIGADEETDVLQQRSKWTLQFSLSHAFLGMTVLAVCCVFYRFDVRLPLWLILPYSSLLAAGMLARRNVSPDFAWGVFAFGWAIVLWDICDTQCDCFMAIGSFDRDETAQCLLLVYLTGIALPVVLTLWSIPLLVRASLGTRSYSHMWLVLILVAMNLDVVILTSGMSYGSSE